MPAFRGLRKLELLRMDHGHYGRDREVANVLLSCPDICDLSLSTAGWAMQDDNQLLPKMVQQFSSKGGKRLRLRSLRLGYGFLPVEASADYLSDLTDLTVLESLRLDNDNVGVSTVVLDGPIDVTQFASARNVTCLTAERLSPDILALVSLLNPTGQLINLSLPRFCDTQPRARMDATNEFWDPERYDEEMIDLPQWDPAQLFSQPLQQAGTHWRRLSIGDIFRTTKLSQDVLDCIATYTNLEDLTLPLPKEMWPRFRDDIMPQLRNLQRLFLVGGDNACGFEYRGLELAYSDFVTRTVEEYNELVQKRDAEFASHMADFARDVFQTNRESIAQGDERAVLKHLGLGGEVYTCMLLPIDASYGLAPFSIDNAGQGWDYHLVKLTRDEAAAFESIQEWYEGMEKLRAGGDNEPEW